MRITPTDELLDGDTPDIIDARDLNDAIDQWQATCIRCGALITHVEHNGTLVFVDDTAACEDDEGDQGVHWPEESDLQTLRELRDLNEEIGLDEMLIRESYWSEYAREFVDDTTDINKDSWLYNYIDWNRVTEDMKMDYSVYTFRGITYYGR